MALIYDGKTFRNLEEQVRKNKQDISNLEKIQTVLNEFGIHVIGKVDDETQLPASSSAFGNAYAVGIQAPFEYYIWTDLQPTPGWLNIGIFPAPSSVQGPQGPDGTSVTAANIVDGYLVLTLTDADGNETQITAGYVKGAQGIQGPRGLQGLQGIQGEQGIQGLTGPQGPRGYTGWALDIISVLSDIAELPDPDTGDRHDAYVIQTGSDYEIYGKVEDGDGFAWQSFGLIAFSTNYVTAATLQTALDNLGEMFVDDVTVSDNDVAFLNNYSGNEVADITFAKINGQNIVGVNTNFQLTTKTEFKSFQSALILGTFVVAKAIEAESLTPVSEESGVEQDTPFILQATGTDNNTAAVPVPSPPASKLKEKQGNSVVINGSIVDSNGRYLNTTGLNQYNGSRRVGTCSYETGIYDPNVSNQHCSEPIMVVPGLVYFINTGAWNNMPAYDQTMNFLGVITYSASGTGYLLNIPANCHYIVINFGTREEQAYNLNISWDGYMNGKFEQYVLHKYDTGSEVLRSAGTVRDSKTPNGTITRRIGSVDLGTLTGFDITSAPLSSISDLVNVIKKPTSTSDSANILCNIYITTSRANVANNDMQISVNTGGYIIFNDSNITSGMTLAQIQSYFNGVMLYYELAAPTTEQGTAFGENIEVNDYGTMFWTDTDDLLVELAQGGLFFYPPDYAMLLDDLNNYVNGDVTALAKKSEVVTQTDLSSQITDLAGLTYNYKKAYKIGNIVFITIRIKNETGSVITTGTDLFNVGSLAPNILIYLNANIDNLQIVPCGIYSSGAVTLGQNIGVNAYVTFNFTYAI